MLEKALYHKGDITMKTSDIIQMRENLLSINKLMERGIQTDIYTEKQYFTGYSYNTLYDWDQYFGAGHY